MIKKIGLVLLSLVIGLSPLMAVMPVAADITPTVVTAQIASDNDDVLLINNGTAWVFGITGNYAVVGYQSSSSQKKGTGLRFNSLAIPQGAFITNAYLTLTASTSTPMVESAQVRTLIHGLLADDAPAFSNKNDYILQRGIDVGGANNENLTISDINWDNIGAWTKNEEYNSPNIRTIIQEIVNRPGWVEGNSMALFWDDHQGYSTATNDVYRIAYGYPHGAEQAAKLTIEYVTDTGYFGIENPYASGGTPYLGQVHGHSNQSYDTVGLNNTYTPYETVDMWRIAGAQFVALTDHDICVPDPEVPDITFIQSEEVFGMIGEKMPHLSALGVTSNLTISRDLSDPPPGWPNGTYQSAIDEATARGAVTVVQHPSIDLSENLSAVTDYEFRQLANYTGIEVYNSIGDHSRGDTTDKFAYALTHSALNTDTNKIWAFTGSDSHGGTQSWFNTIVRNFIMVYAESNTPAALLASIQNGNFYASNGTYITGITTSGNNTITVSTNATSLIEFRGVNNEILQATANATTASYDYQGDELFIFSIVTRNSDGRRAWTQPMWLVPKEAPAINTLAATGYATNPNANTAYTTLHGNISDIGYNPSVNVFFEWGYDTDYGYFTTPVTVTSAGAFSQALSWSGATTPIYYRAQVTANGETVSGERMTAGVPDAYFYVNRFTGLTVIMVLLPLFVVLGIITGGVMITVKARKFEKVYGILLIIIVVYLIPIIISAISRTLLMGGS